MSNLFNVAVQAVPVRGDFHTKIKEALPTAEFAFDHEMKKDCYATWQKAMAFADRDKPYHLIIQDDVGVCVDFEATLDKIIQTALKEFGNRPLPVISLYCPKGIVRFLQGKNIPWVRMIGGSWGVSHLFPTSRIDEFYEYDRRTFIPEYKLDDPRLTLWSCENKEPFWVTVPSLLEHLAPSASMLGYNNRNRVASWFAGDESQLNKSWSFSAFVSTSGASLRSFLNTQIKHDNPLTEEAKIRLGVT